MSADLNPAFEVTRLRQTITLAEEAQRLACDLRSAEHALGETAIETAARWNEAQAIETAAKACRKAARKALANLKVFPDLRSPEQIAEHIAAAKAAALALKAACDAGQRAYANRQIRLAARDCAAIAAHCSAARPGDPERSFSLVITPEQAVTLRRLLEDPAAYALVGWREEMEEDRPEEIARWIADLDSSLRLLGSKHSFATLERFLG